MCVNAANGVVMAECIQIHPAVFLDWIAIEPAMEKRIIETASVVVQTRFRIEVLRAETMVEGIRHAA